LKEKDHVTTRFDKLASRFLSFVCTASISTSEKIFTVNQKTDPQIKKGSEKFQNLLFSMARPA